MMTSEREKRCPRCGVQHGGGADRPCPACLLRVGLEAETEVEATPGPVHGTMPERVGDWRPIRLLGEGGMGVVYLAEDLGPLDRQGALKRVRHGLDSRRVLERFDQERRVLSRMDHPGIARAIDAGAAEDGTPYFVMEYVDGLPITCYCDRHRMDTRERLALFTRLCDAVEHAHRRGILHRDLKPSNILVVDSADGPQPKVIDFGVARAIAQHRLEWSVFTEFGRLVGTPEYMSPEQADLENDDLDTRSDVYGLGVVLYELLVGRTPHDPLTLRNKGLQALLATIREGSFPTPSSRLSTLGDEADSIARCRRSDPDRLRRGIHGELDWIVMRATERDRERRYGSPRELGQELQRFLDDEPVQAGPPGPAYRVRKFVRRHRLGVGVVSAVLAGILIFAGTMAWQARVIVHERDRAQQEAETAEQVASFLVELFRSADPYGRAGENPSARDLLDAGSTRILEDLGDQPEILARLLTEMGWAYEGLGEWDRAIDLLQKAVALHESSEPAGDRTLTAKRLLGLAHGNDENLEQARRVLDEVTDSLTARLGPDHRQTLRSRLAWPEVYMDRGRYADVVETLTQLHGEQAAVLGEDDPDTLITGVFVAAALTHSADSDRAHAYLDAALAGLRLDPEAHDPARANVLMRLGWSCLVLRRFEESERVYKEILASRTAALGPDHVKTLQTQAMLVSSLGEQKRFDEAAEFGTAVLEARMRQLDATHWEVLNSRATLGAMLIGAERYGEAEAQHRAAVEACEVAGMEEDFWSIRNRLGLGEALLGRERTEEARAEFRSVLDYCDASLFDRHPTCRAAMDYLGRIFRDLGRDDEAEVMEARLQAARSPRHES